MELISTDFISSNEITTSCPTFDIKKDSSQSVKTDDPSSSRYPINEEEEISPPETISGKSGFDELPSVCVQEQVGCNDSMVTDFKITIKDNQEGTDTHKVLKKSPRCRPNHGSDDVTEEESNPEVPPWVETTLFYDPDTGFAPAVVGKQSCYPTDISFLADSKNDEQIEIPFKIESETFEVPLVCPDDALEGEDSYWRPGKPLRVAFTTWNMGQRRPRMEEMESVCIHPNAHLIAIGTQENGYPMNNCRRHSRWVRGIASRCLKHQYTLLGTRRLWGIHLALFARRRDVAGYASHIHGSEVRTGFLKICGNKGAVALALSLSMTPQQQPSSLSLSSQAIATPPTSTTTKSEFMTKHEHRNHAFSKLRGMSTPTKKGTLLPCIQPQRQSNGRVPSLSDKLLCDVDDIVMPCLTPSAKLPPLNSMKPFCVSPQARPPICSDAKMQLATLGRGYKSETRNNATPDQNTFPPLEHATPLKQAERSLESLEPQVKPQAAENTTDVAPRSDQPSSASPFLTLLFISAHMAPHQGAVKHRNTDYLRIIRKLRVGTRGKYHKFFKKLVKQRKEKESVSQTSNHPCRVKQAWESSNSSNRAGEDKKNVSSSSCLNENGEVCLHQPKPPSHRNHSIKGRCKEIRRDVTADFDFTIFGGDLNYRINGTRKAIEAIVLNHSEIRSILINNDQLTLERAKNKVFQHFQEGRIHFRPTYKYEIPPSGSTNLNEPNFSLKKMRLPAYCDRVLFKKSHGSSAGHVTLRLYTDVPGVRTSDHRPVASIIDIDTHASHWPV